MSKSVASTQRGSDPDVSTRWVARGSRAKSLRHCRTECVELKRSGARLQDDQLQRVTGDGRRFESQDAGVVIGEPIAILESHLASVLT